MKTILLGFFLALGAWGSLLAIEGILRREGIEGGFWTLVEDDGKLYDIHGEVKFADGDRVRIEGIAPQGLACMHMKGTIFVPTSIERVEAAAAPPTQSTATWKISKKIFTVYGADGKLLWQAGDVIHARATADGRTCILVRRIDPKGGKKRRNYTAVYQDGNVIFEFFESPLATKLEQDEYPIFLGPSRRFGWIQDRKGTIFFDTWTKKQHNYTGGGHAEINESGIFKVWGMMFGKSYTMLKHEGKFE